jgi:hypothetical protein
VGGAIGAFSWTAYIALNHLGTLDHALFQEWALETRWPWESVLSFINRLATGRVTGFESANALGLVFIVILGIVLTIRFRPPYALWVWGNLWVILMRFRPEPYSQFESLIRYALLMFPCFILLAMLLRRWWSITPYVLGAGYWQIIFLGRFVNSIWVA